MNDQEFNPQAFLKCFELEYDIFAKNAVRRVYFELYLITELYKRESEKCVSKARIVDYINAAVYNFIDERKEEARPEAHAYSYSMYPFYKMAHSICDGRYLTHEEDELFVRYICMSLHTICKYLREKYPSYLGNLFILNNYIAQESEKILAVEENKRHYAYTSTIRRGVPGNWI